MKGSRRTLVAISVLGVTVIAGVAACGSSSSSNGSSAGSVDGGAQRSADGGAASSGGSDANVGSGADGSATGPDAADAAAFPYGDRNLGLHEPYPDSLLVQNGGRFYNVRKPPGRQRVAVGDGVTDDTDALRDAFDYLRAAYVAAASARGTDPNGITDQTSSWIYLPAGTYRVTGTLSYRDPIVLSDGGSYPDLVRIRIAGESRETTTIKLDDAAAGFGDAAHPKILLEYQHDGTTFNNWPAANLLTNVTLDTGKGNPGAIGLWFQGANETVMYNVLVQSGDGAGFCGLIFQTGSTHGYYRDITVEGFDDGLCQIPTPNGAPYSATPNIDSDTALEHVTLRGQKKAGALVSAGGTSLRKLWVDESTSGATGLEIEDVGSSIVLDDSLIAGNGSAAAAVQRDRDGVGQVLLARDLVTTGYAAAISAGEGVVAMGPTVEEYASVSPVVLFDGGTGKTLRLPVEDTPLVPWFDAGTDWASVDEYGADGGPDDSVAVQAAMSSGKPVVVFPRATYNLSKTVKVPATVQRIDFLYASVNGQLDVDEASSTLLQMSHRTTGGLTRSAARALALTGYSGDIANTSATPANLYLENVVNIGAMSTFVPPGQKTWIRFIDDEQEPNPDYLNPIDVWINGGTAWVFGFKMECKPVPVFAAMNGSQLEVLNGEVAQTEPQNDVFMVRSDNSDTFFMGFTELGYSPPFSSFTHIVEETRGGTSARVITDGTPQPPVVARDWVEPGTSPTDIVLLYEGRGRDGGG